MMNKSFLTTVLALFLGSQVFAQNNSMEEFMYSSGKIWVAIAVLLIILLFIFIYLWRMDKKITKMEQED